MTGRPAHSERWAVVLFLATAAGALAARPLPGGLPALAAAGLAMAIASSRHRPVALCLAAAALASGLAARSWAGLDPPPPGAEWRGTAVLATDPAPTPWGGLEAEARLGRRGRALVVVRPGESAVLARLRPRLAGERVALAGSLGPVTGRRRAYLAHRHIAAVLRPHEVGAATPGALPYRAANALRRTIDQGASSLPGQTRALFAGFVLGDQRGESVETREAFRASGLSHVLVVSGANVAFALAVAAPLLARLRLAPRFVAALGVLAVFGLLTRWEPSVLRASAMAALALGATTLGRPVSTRQVLFLAATGLLLLDPLLVGSLGFLLSVAATAGIAWLSPVLARRLPLPAAVTIAAQAGAAPVAVAAFGGVPLVSLPANLLAVPAAGPVMMWGLAAGVPAGIVGGPVAAALHLPTRLLVGWVAAVAHRGADAGLGQVRAPHLAGMAAGVLTAWLGWRVASARAPRSRSP